MTAHFKPSAITCKIRKWTSSYFTSFPIQLRVGNRKDDGMAQSAVPPRWICISVVKLNLEKRVSEVIVCFMPQLQRQGWFGSDDCDHACGYSLCRTVY